MSHPVLNNSSNPWLPPQSRAEAAARLDAQAGSVLPPQCTSPSTGSWNHRVVWGGRDLGTAPLPFPSLIPVIVSSPTYFNRKEEAPKPNLHSVVHARRCSVNQELCQREETSTCSKESRNRLLPCPSFRSPHHCVCGAAAEGPTTTHPFLMKALAKKSLTRNLAEP